MALVVRGLLLWVLILPPVTSAAGYAAGDSSTVITVNAIAIETFVYKPQTFRGQGLIVSLHGLGRNAPGYREYTRALADQFGALLIVPLFDRARFPTWRYQQGGIARRSADATLAMEPPGRHSADLLRAIIDTVRREEGDSDMPYVLIGHSAGAQFLVRVAAFGSLRPARIIVANPSSWVMPGVDEPFPYGFGGLPPPLSDDRALERYLAQPLTVLLGTADTGSDNLSTTAGAMRQGAHRHERGLNVFHAAQASAQRRGWTFAWRLVEVPGVGHSARGMYQSPLAALAFCPDSERAAASAAAAPMTWPCGARQP